MPASPTDPPDWIGVWDDLDQLDPITIVLLPSLETRLERRRSDPGRVRSMSEEQVRESHRWAWEAWRNEPRAVVIDSSGLILEEVIVAVEEAATTLIDQPLRAADA